VFYHSESQRSDITFAIKEYEKSSGKQVATQVGNAVSNTFWPAEDYHQHYLQKAGQDASIGSLAPIQCYGNRGPIKKMDKPSIVAVLQKEL
jgi:peptide methionine sulfoxide reductase MsrA